MNEKLQYATMLEIPVNTCNVTFKPIKKRRGKKKRVDEERVKEELVSMVNSQMESAAANEPEVQPAATENVAQTEMLPQEEQSVEQSEAADLLSEIDGGAQDTATVRPVRKKRFKFRISVIGVQLTVIGVLLAAIFLTNALYTDSGINVFLRGVFGTEQSTQADVREYDDFTPVISLSDGATVSLTDGVMTVTGKGSVYAPCDGVVTMLAAAEDGTYTMEITHSEKFKSVLTGIEYAYAGINDSVYYNIPVGYVSAGATMCFTDSDGAIISDYQIIDDAVVWAV